MAFYSSRATFAGITLLSIALIMLVMNERGERGGNLKGGLTLEDSNAVDGRRSNGPVSGPPSTLLQSVRDVRNGQGLRPTQALLKDLAVARKERPREKVYKPRLAFLSTKRIRTLDCTSAPLALTTQQADIYDKSLETGELDWSNKNDTADQVAMNNYVRLRAPSLKGKSILHVGAGRHSVAALLRDAARIVALTIVPDELRSAPQQGNYRVFLCEKYRAFTSTSAPAGCPAEEDRHEYSMILDNNLSSFSCCAKHFEDYIATLAAALAPGGEIVTHLKGAKWSSRNSAGIKLDVSELKSIAQSFSLYMSTWEQDPLVIILRRVDATGKL